MTRAQPRRPGVTLMEVLVTIFIMGVGMIALLTLFPVGAVSMARALKDDRASSAAVNADGIAWAQNLRGDPLVTPSFTTFGGVTVTTGSGPSFGVFVDPQGQPNVPIFPSSVGAYVGPPSTPGLPRVNMSLQNYTNRGASALSVTEAARWCTLQDDMLFQPNGTPDLSAGGPSRYGSFSWAWMLREADAGIPWVINCWVIVYRNRVTATANGETTYATNFPATGNVGDTSVTVAALGLNLRTGSWVLDTTQAANMAVPGYFYRVVDYFEDKVLGQTVLQLENPLQAPCKVLTVMENVVEVFDRGSNRWSQ